MDVADLLPQLLLLGRRQLFGSWRQIAAGMGFVISLELLFKLDALHSLFILVELLSQRQLDRMRLRRQCLSSLVDDVGVLLWDLKRVAQFIVIWRLNCPRIWLIVRF